MNWRCASQSAASAAMLRLSLVYAVDSESPGLKFSAAAATEHLKSLRCQLSDSSRVSFCT